MTAPHATVLIVDDDAFVRSSAAEIVRSAGYQVREAGDGEGALAVLADGGIDVVVLDLRMPGPGGRGVLDGLGEHGPPVVLVTGSPSPATPACANTTGSSRSSPSPSSPAPFSTRWPGPWDEGWVSERWRPPRRRAPVVGCRGHRLGARTHRRRR